MDWLVLARCALISWRARKVGGSAIHSLIYIRSRLHVDYNGLQLKFTHQVVLVVVGCSVLLVTTPAYAASVGTSAPTTLI